MQRCSEQTPCAIWDATGSIQHATRDTPTAGVLGLAAHIGTGAWAHPHHIITGTGLAAAKSAPGPGSPLQHL
jgi:hypothetical protein